MWLCITALPLVGASVAQPAAVRQPTTAGWDDRGFFSWFESELSEVSDVPLKITGNVPDLSGMFVQTGPGRFGFGSSHFTHMMDGYAKTLAIRFDRGKATYTTKYVRTAFLNDSIKDGKIARGMFVGGVEPDPHWGATSMLGANDNNYIKARKLKNGQAMLVSDTMIASFMDEDFVSVQHNEVPSSSKMMGVPGQAWQDKLDMPAHICMLGTMAHAAEDPTTGALIGAMGCQGVAPMQNNYHFVFTIHPHAPTTRQLLAKIELPRGRAPSYMHSLAATPNYVVLIAEPLFMRMASIMSGVPMGKGGLYTTNETTYFQIVSKKDGSVRTLNTSAFIFGHILNSYEEGTDIVIDLTWYEAGNATTLGWFNRWFISFMKNDPVRESWPSSQVMRYRLGLDGSVHRTPLFPKEVGTSDFEVPKINEDRSGLPYCIVYMMQFHSYDYNRDESSIVPGPMGAVGLAKRNVCTGERLGWYQPNEYPSEVQFVPRPGGTAEDDGVLISIVYDANANSSYLQLLDARTMKRQAKALLPVRSPFLIHASYFPKEGA